MSIPVNSLTAQGLVIGYDPKGEPAVHGLDLSLQPGELLAVVGPNGSGKSTLIRALSRVLRPSGGTVLLDGADMYSSRDSRDVARKLSVVSQATPVSFDFTTREVVEMGRMPYVAGHPFASLGSADRDAVDRALRVMEVDDLADRAISTLSGGEQQRVMIARALAQEPQILLLDEPTAHLDIQHQLSVLALVRRLAHRERKAVLTVLHDLNIAAAYADRMLLMKEGCVVAMGTPAEVLSAENVEAAYGTRVWLRSDPASGRPFISALPEIDGPEPGVVGLRVHLIAGGGSGVGILILLRQLGCDVTMGVLNSGDTDQEAAEALGVRYVPEKPFTPISDGASQAADALAADAALVIVADVPFGRGNIAGLEHAVSLRERGTWVLALDPSGGFHERDFTGGHATELWSRLASLGSATVGSIQELAGRIHELARDKGTKGTQQG